MSARARYRPWFRPEPTPLAMLRERIFEGCFQAVQAADLSDVEAAEYVNPIAPERWAEYEAALEKAYREAPLPVAIFGTPVDLTRPR